MNIQLFSAALALFGAATLSFQGDKPAGEAAEKPLAVGDDAPHFTLNDHKGQLATQNGDTEGWTLIAFDPQAMPGG